MAYHRCGQFPNPDDQNPNKILPTCLVCVGSADVQSTAIAEWWWNPYHAFDAMSSLLSKTRLSEMKVDSLLGKNQTGPPLFGLYPNGLFTIGLFMIGLSPFGLPMMFGLSPFGLF